MKTLQGKKVIHSIRKQSKADDQFCGNCPTVSHNTAGVHDTSHTLRSGKLFQVKRRLNKCVKTIRPFACTHKVCKYAAITALTMIRCIAIRMSAIGMPCGLIKAAFQVHSGQLSFQPCWVQHVSMKSCNQLKLLDTTLAKYLYAPATKYLHAPAWSSCGWCAAQCRS